MGLPNGPPTPARGAWRLLRAGSRPREPQSGQRSGCVFGGHDAGQGSVLVAAPARLIPSLWHMRAGRDARAQQRRGPVGSFGTRWEKKSTRMCGAGGANGPPFGRVWVVCQHD